MSIIRSILDNDVYKISMMWAVMNKFPDAEVEYDFINRGNTIFPENFDRELRKEIQKMEKLKLSRNEQKFLEEKCKFLPQMFIDFLTGYRFDSKEITIVQTDGDLSVKGRGYWYRTILWEVPIMATISELYFKMTGQKPTVSNEENVEIMQSKLLQMHSSNALFADFGTRRRYSFANQETLVKSMTGNMFDKSFIGTSNMYLAMKYNLTPIGTHAHEWFMYHAARYGYKMANKMALENWVDVYKGDLGIALTDTYTTNQFLKIFDTKFAKLFDGVRQDSGDPFEIGEKVVAHYEKLGIDPTTKTIIFSDSLDIDLAIKLHKAFSDRIRVRFGIGTFLTNDVGVKALNMVIKIVNVKIDGCWIPTVKISDSQGKETGPWSEIRKAKEVLGITPPNLTLFG